MRWVKYFLLSIFALTFVLGLVVYRVAAKQGYAAVDWDRFSLAKVKLDSFGVPTIEAPQWKAVIEAQGFVMASHRLWQMDLMRRSGLGRLAEWFGGSEPVLDWDRKRRLEDWPGVAERAAASLPAAEKEPCDAFAVGVNRFIDEYSKQWGVEYRLLGEVPEPWSCRDSMVILLSMAEDLSDAVEDEATAGLWKRHLPQDWFAFLFSQDHPWNRPLFGPKATKPSGFPAALPTSPIQANEAQEPEHPDRVFRGSNAWVYRGPNGPIVANDPHLTQSVPQLWYAVHLKKSEGEWAVGVTIPGIPGVVLGRNAHIAWGFTNAKEDVDDLLEEIISPDGKQYVARRAANAGPVWKAVREVPFEIAVRAGRSEKGVARFTHRGPLLKVPFHGDRVFSRQWLAYQPGALGLPTLQMVSATNWDEFNAAVDRFSIPAQGIVFGDRTGGIGVRISGTGIRRRKPALVPSPAVEGEWLGLEQSSQRLRVYYPPGKGPHYLSTANQRLWVSAWGAHWSSDLRQDRIDQVLGASRDLGRAQMEALQVDTHSRFLKSLLEFIAQNATPTEEQAKVVKAWREWSGVATDSEAVFAQAIRARGLLSALLLGRVRRQWLEGEEANAPYRWKLENAWMVRVLQSQGGGLAAFGLGAKETAQWLLERVSQSPAPQSGASAAGYAHANRWKAQHPFVRGVPLLGRFFRVGEPPQFGFEGVVRVERPLSGATTRLVWELGAPDLGSWAFPVGQSGHLLSRHYISFRPRWFTDTRTPVGVPGPPSN